MERPICTAEKPAEEATRKDRYGCVRKVWNHAYVHPDATRRCIDDDHEDYEYHCPHCDRRRIEEGPDY